MFRISVFVLFFFAIGISQTLMNSYGIGTVNQNSSTAALGNGSNSITPSFANGVSLSNAATWKNLDYTYLHIDYSGGQTIFGENNIGQFSGLHRAQLIVPIKSKHAFGLSLYPYASKQADLMTPSDSMTVPIGNKSEGGVNALSTSVGIELSENESLGLSYAILFGSSRLIKSMTIDESSYVQTTRMSHNAGLLDMSITSDRFIYNDRPIILYGRIGFAIQPMDVRIYKYHLFEDIDGSGSHNSSTVSSQADFPNPGSVPPPEYNVVKKAYSPFSISAGLNYPLKKSWNIVSEFELLNNNYSSDYTLFAPLQDAVVSQTKLQIGINRFHRSILRNMSDRLSIRSGIYSHRYLLDNTAKGIMENGIALGFGYIFGITKNQLDISYQMGVRSGLTNSENEKFSKFSMGISIGDIWFVKRREL